MRAKKTAHRPFRPYDEETRAQCLAALLAGQTPIEVAEAYKVPYDTAKWWRAELRRKGELPDQTSDLLQDLVEESLKTLIAQQRFFRNEDWLNKQPASELAVLHGVTADKTFRILEAVERAHPPEGGESSDSDSVDG